MAIPQVRVNIQAPFPAFVRGSGPITLSKVNGVWTIGYNVMATAMQAPPLPNFPTDFFLVYDSLSGTYFRMSLQSLEAAIGPLPTLPNNTVMGNVSGIAGPPAALTQTQLLALIGLFTAAASGIVPASGGGNVNFLRADGTWAIPPGGGGGAVASVFGRTGAVLAQSGDYSFSQISGVAAPAQLPLFSASLAGAVIASGGGTANFLRADGTWAPVNFAQITGTAGPSQMTLFSAVANGAVPASGGGVVNFLRADGTWASAPVTSFNARTGAVTPQSGDYAFSQISGIAAASQLPLFTSLANGAVAASGGGTVNFLRADGNWAVPGAGGGSLTVGVTAIGGGATGRVLFDNGGILQEYTQAALTSYIQQFTSTTPGTVPLSGGGTTAFLRADGSWVAPPTGGAGSIIIGTSTIGGGVSGRVLFDNAGIAGEYTPAQLTAQIAAFTSTLSGAAPASGGGTTNFLRADGTWNAPPYPVTSVFGRTGAVVAATNDYSFSQISGTAGPAQLPLFTATLAGAVAGSGGGTTNFLRADGTWVAPPTGTSPVTSVFGRTGAVVAAANDYSFSQISGTATPAQLPLFTSVANGIVAASGGGTANFLRADGSWAAPPALGAQANNTVLGNVSGITATPVALTTTQLTTLVNLFSSTLSGAVPSSGGGTTNYLRADGTWTTVAPASITPIATNTVLGNVTAGTAAPTALSKAQLTTLVNTFTTTLSGAVPSTGASPPANSVLLASGSWGAAPTFTASAPGYAPAGSGAAGTFLTPSATWAAPALKMSVQVFTVLGANTYTPPAGLQWAIVECVGGGGGGGTAFGSSGLGTGGGGGGSGAYCRVLFSASAIGGSQTVTIGAGGVSGANGTTTSFGALCSSGGGVHGGANDATTVYGGGGDGGSAGTISGGTGIAIDGQKGFDGMSQNSGATLGGMLACINAGQGANGMFGSGGRALQATNNLISSGLNGSGYGAGGSGGVSNNFGGTPQTANGGTGSGGICIVTEYSF